MAAEFRDSGIVFGTVAILSLGLAVMVGEPVTALILCAVTAKTLFNVARPRTRVRVTDEGVELGYFVRSPGLIRWDDVRDIREGRWGVIELDLKDEKAFRERLSPLDRVIAATNRLVYGFGPTAVSAALLKGSKLEIRESLEDALDSYTLAAFRDDAVLPEPDSSGGGVEST